jgi:hypothetical protein
MFPNIVKSIETYKSKGCIGVVEKLEKYQIEDLFVNNTLDKFEDIQIQFHRIAGYKELVDKTRKMLSTTHDLIWCFDMIWECWRRKK